ncbi:MAG: elongation factor P [Deltaproteobacteria bacterium]|nr:elongation factor P [Deltaproteobacteria bacterium]
MYQASDIRKGLKIELDGQPYSITYFQFVKPGKGQAFTRTKCKNLITGAVLERTFKIVESLTPADVEDHTMQFLYAEGETYAFMHMETYEQISIPKDVLGDAVNFLVDQMEVTVTTFNSRPVSIELPNFVVLEVTYCEPGAKGNTAQGGNKPATVSTGATINVPLFVEQGTLIKIDTRTGEYVERVKA